ncbi:MAG: histidine phosphatase family protein [Candidatus Atribacteria bacterium]|nr:histidine phosphatase family protein [Candidatus Atribacteria bacterium]
MAVKLLLIRHGESEANIDRKFSGFQDVKLTEKGIWQAKRLAQRLREVKVDAVYCSNLSRARHTAEIVFQNRGMNINIVPQLKEINFGAWEGLTYEEVRLKFGYGEDFSSWPGNIDVKTVIPQGESIVKLNARVIKALNEILNKHLAGKNDETIAIVCHGGTIRVILANALNINLGKIWNIGQGSTALNEINYYNHTPFVNLINDMAHLEDWREKDLDKIEGNNKK